MTPSPAPILNVVPGTIFHMDNIVALRGINSSTSDLIATDPPFNTGRNREAVGGKYPDQWWWVEEKHGPWLEQIRDLNRAVAEVIEAAMHAHTKDLGAFLCFLSERLIECHRILKDTGSIYLHCDPTASHYIKAVMDAIFGAKNFRNEIVWKWTVRGFKGSQFLPRSYNTNTDSVLFYTKTSDASFHADRVLEPYSPEYIEKAFKLEDDKGRYYLDVAYNRQSASPRPNLCYEYRNFSPPYNSGWKISREWMEELDRSGEIVVQNGKLCRKIRPKAGRIRNNLWDDINEAKGKERTGYPDQKPVALYERIVAASSNPGDLVLDPFCGCGTTLVEARNLDRRFIGIDRNDDAKEMILCNLAGMKKAEVAENRKKTQHSDPGWIDRLLAKQDALFKTDPPERTDDLEEEATPGLATIHRHKERPIFDPATMKRMLYEQFGPRCWGCDFHAPAGERGIKYLELDHITPKADGGSNHLTNRALLCGPCNRDKSDTLTLGALRRQIYGSRKKANQHPIDLKTVAAWTRQQELEAQQERNRNEAPLFAN